MMSQERRVVITGLGAVTPMGLGKDVLWDGLMEGRCPLGPVKSFDASHLCSSIAGEVPTLQITEFVPKSHRKSAKIMSRDIQLAVATAYLAVKDAGLKTRCLLERGDVEGPSNLDPARFGANIGAGLICADLNELAGALATAADENGDFSLKLWGKQGMENLTPLWLLKFLPNMLACHVTIVHDAQASSNTLTCAEASSHLAVGEAFRTIARGAVDVCICGGAESRINPMSILRQQLFGRCVTGRDATPETACRPFAIDRAGMITSEGAGLLTLESLDHARKRGARIYAELTGFGASANTHSFSEPHPEGLGIVRAIKAALADAKVGPEAIDLIVTFGTGIPDFDASEAAALKSVFGSRLPTIPCVATKGAIGNSGAGAGAVDLAIGVMSIVNQTIIPSRNCGNTDPQFGLKFIQGGPVDGRIQHVLSVTYALSGGQNAAIVIRKFAEGGQ